MSENFTTISVGELAKRCDRERSKLLSEMRLGTRMWGKWRFNPSTYNLEFDDGLISYEVDLERCSTDGEMFDWLAHMNEKTWMDAEQLGWLFKAFAEIFHPIRGWKPGRKMKVKEQLDAMLTSRP